MKLTLSSPPIRSSQPMGLATHAQACATDTPSLHRLSINVLIVGHRVIDE
ncbi:hypothetical protein [Kluyvera genomosp. 1]|nr:hypothetical protein [Kluyvera genomosp. 1]